MFRKIIAIVILSVALKLNGQMTGSFRYDDSLTYSLYTEKRWDDLISAGQSALKNGHDYYYMRMRIGIAYNEKRNYAMSALQFRKALALNADDQIALEYLFYSYYLSGHTSQALALMSFFYPQNRERILKEYKIRKTRLTIETFFSNSGTEEIISDPDSYFVDPEPGSQIVTQYFINNEIYASHILGNRTSYFHSYTNLVKDNYLHYYDGTLTAHLFPQRIVQNQYYGSLSYYSSTGWIFSPSFHLLTTAYPVISISTAGMNTSVKTTSMRSNGYVAGIAITKSMGFVIVGAEGGYSNLNNLQRAQGTISLVVYPRGNSDIYFGGKISAGKKLKNRSTTPAIVEGFTAGFSVAGKVWFEFSGLTGDMDYYTDNNGLYIYNSTDVIRNKLSGRIIIPIEKIGLTCFAGGGLSSYSSEFIPEDGIISNNTNKLNYNSTNFTGGLSWNF